jgi:hypothetical protein
MHGSMGRFMLSLPWEQIQARKQLQGIMKIIYMHGSMGSYIGLPIPRKQNQVLRAGARAVEDQIARNKMSQMALAQSRPQQSDHFKTRG